MSAVTPEARVKKKIKAVLDYYSNHNIYVFMPVPGGFGAPTLDYLGFIKGRGFAIEAKRPGGKPTPRQERTIKQIENARAAVFVIDGDAGLAELDAWLFSVVRGTIQ